MCKIVILGSPYVGKTALTNQFVQHFFVDQYDPTIDDGYRATVGKQKIEIIDTSSQSEYYQKNYHSIKSGDGFLLVYSITSRQSFDDLVAIIQQVQRIKQRVDVPMIIVGNKADLVDQRVVTDNDAIYYTHQYASDYLESSAKTGHNVDMVYHRLLDKVLHSWSSDGSIKPQTTHFKTDIS
jgi:GTPase KRas protein